MIRLYYNIIINDMRHVHYLCLSLYLVEGTHREHVQLVEVDAPEVAHVVGTLSMLTLWQAERHFCHLRFTGAATILSFFRSILLAWILLAKLSVNVQ